MPEYFPLFTYFYFFVNERKDRKEIEFFGRIKWNGVVY